MPPPDRPLQAKEAAFVYNFTENSKKGSSNELKNGLMNGKNELDALKESVAPKSGHKNYVGAEIPHHDPHRVFPLDLNMCSNNEMCSDCCTEHETCDELPVAFRTVADIEQRADVCSDIDDDEQRFSTGPQTWSDGNQFNRQNGVSVVTNGIGNHDIISDTVDSLKSSTCGKNEPWRDKWILECIDHMNAYLLSQQERDESLANEVSKEEAEKHSNPSVDGMNEYLRNNRHLIADGDADSDISSANEEVPVISTHVRKASSDHSPDFLEFDFQAADDEERIDAGCVSDDEGLFDSDFVETSVNHAFTEHGDEVDDKDILLQKLHDCDNHDRVFSDKSEGISASSKIKCTSCGDTCCSSCCGEDLKDDVVLSKCCGQQSCSDRDCIKSTVCCNSSICHKGGDAFTLSPLQVPLCSNHSPLRCVIVKSHSFDDESAVTSTFAHELHNGKNEIKNTTVSQKKPDELRTHFRLYPIKSRSFDEGMLLRNFKLSFRGDSGQEKEHIYEELDSYLKEEEEDEDYVSLQGPVKNVMLWSESEAYALQVNQIGKSSCGATAVINVLRVLGFDVLPEIAAAAVHTNMRAELSPVPEYLYSRSVAGATHKELIDGIDVLTQGAVAAKFFHLYPARQLNLSRWLGYWMTRGVVPVATLNLQVATQPGEPIPDAWHHQMVHGVSSKGIHLTNPVECVPAEVLSQQLCSPSVLLIRREDILARNRGDGNLYPLITHPDPRWAQMNVLGQVANILREDEGYWEAKERREMSSSSYLTSHIRIPAAYKSGITLFARRDSPGFDILQRSTSLSLLSEKKED